VLHPSRDLGSTVVHAAGWRDPCTAFRCEEATCAAPHYIRYFTQPPPFDKGRSRKRAPIGLLEWEEDVCGVGDLALPEAHALARSEHRYQMPCPMAPSERELCTEAFKAHTRREFDQVAPAYAAHVLAGCNSTSTAARAAGRDSPSMSPGGPFASSGASLGAVRSLCDLSNYTYDNRSAKVAARSHACAFTRCWTYCCAACAERSWCISWQWDKERGECSLAAAPSVEGTPSFERVVGEVMRGLPAHRSAWNLVDSALAHRRRRA